MHKKGNQTLRISGRLRRRVHPVPGLIRDSATYHLLASDPQWASLVLKTGYTYNFSIAEGRWLIAPAVMAGPGILEEIDSGNKGLRSIINAQAWINAGYNGQRYYVYMNGTWDNLRTNLLLKNMRKVNTDISITLGYRFADFKKKVPGLL